MIGQIDSLVDGARYDIVVIGAGAGGMAAALYAAIEGEKVLLVERTEFLGGTTALSAATTWVPNTQHAKPDGDSIANAMRFLDQVVGNHSRSEMRRVFLEAGPDAIARLEAHSDAKFRAYALHPDYVQEAEGATLGGRALEPLPFDGRKLGSAFALVRPPIPEFTILGGMMVDRTDIGHLMKLTKSWQSFRHVAMILGRYAFDRIRWPRGTRLVMGNALIGRFLLSLLKRDVDILAETSVAEFLRGKDGVAGLVLESKGSRRKIEARLGVILASGGFNHHKRRRAELLPQPTPQYSPAAPGHTGEAQDLAVALGARFGEGSADNAFWTPVSVRTRPDGTIAVFPHFVMDRSKPGTVCVNQLGRRFVNESRSYHEFVRAVFETNPTAPCIPAFIITDAEGLRKYGLGMVRPGARRLNRFLADGYLTQAPTVCELAGKLRVNADALERTVADMNRYAETGVDTKFGRGTTPYHKVNGDSAHKPNPTLGRIKTPPFYAVRLYPGDLGAATGLLADQNAQVLDGENKPIGHLYACGNDMQSIMGGTYPGPGITIGPAIVFAYLAVRHAVHSAPADRT
jgi:succinate dehydrogenase/fumarate reductase flavoprotein subunit